MEIVQRIMKNRSTTSTSTPTKYNCDICNDTTWVQGNGGMKRCSCYEMDHIKRLWETSGVDIKNRNKTFTTYEPYDKLTQAALNMAQDYAKNFESIKQTETNFMALMGQNGAGKTHLLLAVGKNLINRQRVGVVYMPYLEATAELKRTVTDKEYHTKLINRYSRAKVLIIDDLFKDKTKNGRLIADINDKDIKYFFPILNNRYLNNLPTLISTELTPQMLIQLDESIAGRILQKCDKRIIAFKEKKYNYRLRKFM